MNRDCTPVDPLNNVLYLSNMSEAILPFIPTADSGSQSSIVGYKYERISNNTSGYEYIFDIAGMPAFTYCKVSMASDDTPHNDASTLILSYPSFILKYPSETKYGKVVMAGRYGNNSEWDIASTSTRIELSPNTLKIKFDSKYGFVREFAILLIVFIK